MANTNWSASFLVTNEENYCIINILSIEWWFCMKNKAKFYVTNFLLAINTLIITMIGCVIYGLGEGTIDVLNLPYPVMRAMVVTGIVVLAMPVIISMYRNIIIWQKIEMTGKAPVIIAVIINIIPYILIYAGAQIIA